MKTHLIALDTNVLLIPGKKQSRDIFQELQKLLGAYEALVPSFIVNELGGIARSRGTGPLSKRAQAAKLALSLLDTLDAQARTTDELSAASGTFYKVRIVPATKEAGTVDQSLIIFAQKMGAQVATADERLRWRAQRAGVVVQFMGSGKYSKKRVVRTVMKKKLPKKKKKAVKKTKRVVNKK